MRVLLLCKVKPYTTTDYYPYGKERNHTGQNSKRRFLGEEYDVTGLNYLNARYYDGERGQFLSQDPVFWGFNRDKNTFTNFITDPQLQNSYGYARNNPIKYKDPMGQCIWDACIAESIFAGAMLTAIIGGIGLSTYGAVKGDTPMIELGFGLQDVGTAGGALSGQSRGMMNPITSKQNEPFRVKGGINILEQENLRVGNSVGHTASEHIGKSDAYLQSRTGVRVASSYYDVNSANESINKLLQQNNSDIMSWLKTANVGEKNSNYSVNMNKNIGRVYDSRTGQITTSQKATAVLIKNSQGSFNVLTSYPTK